MAKQVFKQFNPIHTSSLLSEARQVIQNRWIFLTQIGKSNYGIQEQILTHLFTNPLTKVNVNSIDVYHKASILNMYYSTMIWDIQPIVNGIISLNIDNALLLAQLGVVQQIANITAPVRCNLSFASKYCACHNPSGFPIYDFYVRDYLARVISKGNLNNWPKGSISYWRDQQLRNNYSLYVNAYNAFIAQYNLSSLTYREVDWYIWTACKCNLNHLNLFSLI